MLPARPWEEAGIPTRRPETPAREQRPKNNLPRSLLCVPAFSSRPSRLVLLKCGMEEVEDTPIFQERVTYLEGQSKAIKAEVKLLIGQAHAFAHAGVQYAEAGKAFAAKADELGAVMPALQSVGAGLKELFKLVEIMSQKQNELTQPLEQLCAQIKQV